MLLLLTLALLAGATCRAHNILGNNRGGKYFYVHGEEKGEIKTIRIFYSLTRLLKGIQLQFHNHWSDVYGGHSASYEEFHLKDGEHVIKVQGSVGICLNSLTFITNKGTEFTFGKKRGRQIGASGGPDKHLQTVNGMYSLLCLRGIGFKWTHGPEKPQREPTIIPGPDKEKEDSKDKDKGKDKDKDEDDNDDDGDDDDDDDNDDDNDEDDDDNDDDDDEDDKKEDEKES